MDSIEELGFIKIDLLGQAGLSVLRDTVANSRRRKGSRSIWNAMSITPSRRRGSGTPSELRARRASASNRPP